MKTYLVGGAVRDTLLGVPVVDRDWVVIGETPESMVCAGFMPCGLDFPVFLHPTTMEQYALARSDRKPASRVSSVGGFVFHTELSVTLEEDLLRRDLTINAMATTEDGAVIDPHGGRADLAARIFRHVSDAFTEDPVRILRLARFAARWPDFTLAPETLTLMTSMVDAGMVDNLVPERVWQELAKGLMQRQPSRMLEVLRDCGALAKLLPEVDALELVEQPAAHHPEIFTGIHVRAVLDTAARFGAPLAVRYAALMHDLGNKGTTPVGEWPKHHAHEQRSAKLAKKVGARLRVPTDCRELADVVAAEHGNVHASLTFGAGPVIRLLERCDAFRRPERFELALLACECDARGRTGFEERPYPQRARLAQALTIAASANTAAEAERVAALGRAGVEIGEAIHALRIRTLADAGFAAVKLATGPLIPATKADPLPDVAPDVSTPSIERPRP